MVIKFENPLFSKAGQKERLANVGATLKAAVTGKGVASHTGSKVVDKVLSAASSSPFTTALVGAGAVSAATFGIANTLKAVATKKVLATTLAVPAATSVIANVGVKKTATIAAKAPRDISNFASNVAGAIGGKTSIGTIIKENPILSGGVAALGAAVAAKPISNVLNTVATNKNTKALSSLSSTSLPATTKKQKSVSQMLPVVAATQNVSSSRKRTSRRRRKSPSPPSQSINVKIYNQTRSQSNKFIKMIR